MAVKKSTPKGKVKKKSVVKSGGRKKRVKVEVAFPTERSVPCTEIGEYSILIYGEEKVGKTSLASKFPEALMLMFEAGGKALSVFQTPVNSWAEFLAFLDLLEAGDHEFNTVVVDTADLAANLCNDFVCQKLVIEHPSDAPYGKGWSALREEFQKAMNRVCQLPTGVIFLSHATEKEITRRTGETSHRIVPTMSKMAREVLEGLVDVIAYYHYGSEGERVLQIAGDDLVSCGHRIEGAFQRQNVIPMGDSAGEGYANFVTAFGNGEVKRAVSSRKKAVVKKKTVRKKK
jgi:hypothetical protein